MEISWWLRPPADPHCSHPFYCGLFFPVVAALRLPAPRAGCSILFTWQQTQRTGIRFQGKTGTVLLRPRGTLTGEISLCCHLKCSKSVPLLPRKARAK
jgi:hypothetical protein